MPIQDRYPFIDAAAQGVCHPAQLRALIDNLENQDRMDTLDEFDVAVIIQTWLSTDVQRDYFNYFTEDEREDNNQAFKELVGDALLSGVFEGTTEES